MNDFSPSKSAGKRPAIAELKQQVEESATGAAPTTPIAELIGRQPNELGAQHNTLPAPPVSVLKGLVAFHEPQIFFSYPNPETLPAIPLAIMLMRRSVSTLAMTYSHMHATRLPAYIQTLEELGLEKAIIAKDLPLTPRQRRRKHSKPFAQYCLHPSVISQEGEKGEQWALEVLRENGINVEKFPISKEWLELEGAQ